MSAPASRPFRLVVLLLVTLLTAFSPAGAPLPDHMDRCKNDGYLDLARQDGTPFRNQGDCVSYVVHGGILVAAVPRLEWVVITPLNSYFMRTEGEWLQPGSTVARSVTFTDGLEVQFDTTVLSDGTIDFEHFGAFGCTGNVERLDATATTAAGLPISDSFVGEPSPPC